MDIIFISYLGLFYPFSDDGGGAGAGWIAVEKALSFSYLFPFSDDGGGAGAGWIAVEKAAQVVAQWRRCSE